MSFKVGSRITENCSKLPVFISHSCGVGPPWREKPSQAMLEPMFGLVTLLKYQETGRTKYRVQCQNILTLHRDHYWNIQTANYKFNCRNNYWGTSAWREWMQDSCDVKWSEGGWNSFIPTPSPEENWGVFKARPAAQCSGADAAGTTLREGDLQALYTLLIRPQQSSATTWLHPRKPLHCINKPVIKFRWNSPTSERPEKFILILQRDICNQLSCSKLHFGPAGIAGHKRRGDTIVLSFLNPHGARTPPVLLSQGQQKSFSAHTTMEFLTFSLFQTFSVTLCRSWLLIADAQLHLPASSSTSFAL